MIATSDFRAERRKHRGANNRELPASSRLDGPAPDRVAKITEALFRCQGAQAGLSSSL